MSEAASVVQRDEEAEERLKSRSRISSLVEQPALWVAVLDVLLVLLFGAISPGHVFFNADNFTNMALDSAQIVLIAAGLALLLGARCLTGRRRWRGRLTRHRLRRREAARH